MALPAFLLDNFARTLQAQSKKNNLYDSDLVSEIAGYAATLHQRLKSPDTTWKDFTNFWPPRYVEALTCNKAIVFFGAGLSAACGVPTWDQLLSKHLKLDKNLIEDEDLKSDPLTLAELASQFIGPEALQSILKDISSRAKSYSINHAALAALRCPAYITTNYDCLFEAAWKDINGEDLIVVTTDADFSKGDNNAKLTKGKTLLYKIHGCAHRGDEPLILTRRDYRFHYRTNEMLFGGIRKLLRERHTLFVGFSHRDPEVSRLVEDVIHEYEKFHKDKLLLVKDSRPQFYSLQFDMRAHTPEIFAARGIVALNLKLLPTKIENIKTKALAVSLVDLLGAKKKNLHSKVSLEEHLHKAIAKVGEPLFEGLKQMGACVNNAKGALEGRDHSRWMGGLLAKLKTLASQGIYLLDDQGNVVALALPSSLDETLRKPAEALNNRSYFKQAKFFRKPFISNADRSVFNSRSTFFLCVPIVENEQMRDLLFSACQIGQWRGPLEAADEMWRENYSFLLIDGNGTCLLPPNNEFRPTDNAASSNESKGANLGYEYERLLALSRRDMLAQHISRSVVPITQDDDFFQLSEDLQQYTIIAEIPQTRWKIGVSMAVWKPASSSEQESATA